MSYVGLFKPSQATRYISRSTIFWKREWPILTYCPSILVEGNTRNMSVCRPPGRDTNPGTSRIRRRGASDSTAAVCARSVKSQSVRPSVLASSPSGSHDQILAVVRTVAVLLVMGRPPLREDGSVLWQVTVFVLVICTYVLRVFCLIFNNLYSSSP